MKDADVENGPVDPVVVRSRMNWEIGIDIYTLPCVKHIVNWNMIYSAGSSAWCSVVTSMGGMGWGWREVYEGGHTYIHTQVYIYS